MGLLGGVELVADTGTRQPFVTSDDELEQMVQRAARAAAARG